MRYDYAPIIVRGMEFKRNVHEETEVQTKSLNEGTMIKIVIPLMNINGRILIMLIFR